MPDLFSQRARKYSSQRPDLFSQRARKYSRQIPGRSEPADVQQRQEPSGNLLEGLKASALGQLLGYDPQYPTEDAPFTESLAFKAGALGGDAPAMSIGSALGGGLAGLLGGGPLGAVIGAGAGAFGLPELIKQAVSYFKTPTPKDESLVEKLGSIGDIFLQTGKQGLIGAATGGAGRLFPLLKLAPGLSKLAGTKVGREIIKGGTELAAMTGAGAALEGELPSVKDVAGNVLLLGGMKGAGAAVAGAKKAFGRKALPKATTKTAKAELDILKKRALELVPKPVSEGVEKLQKQKPAYELLREHVGKRNERIVESQFKWSKIAEQAQGKGEFTPKQLEEAIYYRQKTGNPEVGGDTFENLKERIPESLRKVVDTDIDAHFKKSMEELNKKPYLKKIRPRESVAETYIPGFYENPEKFQSIQGKLPQSVQTQNPFANMKTFINYNEALTKAGMKPRYKNMFELVRAYDKVTAKMIAGSDLLTDIAKAEKTTGDRIIVNPNEFEAYSQAKREGYVPFYDPVVKEFGRPGEAKWRPSDKPALVAPEYASALQGIFSKQAYTPESKYWKTYENIGDTLRFGRVRLSFFHYVPLTESAAGALGMSKALRFRSIAKQGNTLRSNVDFMKDAAKHGLIVHKPVERYQSAKKVEGKFFKAAEKYLPEKVTTKLQESTLAKGLKKLAKSQEYLFEKYHPNLKAVTWQDFINRATAKSIKEGKPFTSEQRYSMKTKMADLVNSMYGGQNWDVQRVFNSSYYRKWLKGVIGYPDWTTSALRQAAGAFSGGLKGQASRKYWLKFGINTMLVHNAMRYFNGGWEQTDKKDYKISGVRFNPSKAWKELTDPDPIEGYKFPLPDIPIKVGGIMFNPGREALTEKEKEKRVEGSRLYTHLGKQAFEIEGWFKHADSTLFSKANPILSILWKQIVGSTPSKRENFQVRGKWGKGDSQRKPWDATKPMTGARLASRLAAFAGDVAPFSMKTLSQYGGSPYLATGLGSVPISKGTTPWKAAPILEKAFEKNDVTKINRIRAALKDNGYSEKQIKSAVLSARKRAGKWEPKRKKKK